MKIKITLIFVICNSMMHAMEQQIITSLSDSKIIVFVDKWNHELPVMAKIEQACNLYKKSEPYYAFWIVNQFESDQKKHPFSSEIKSYIIQKYVELITTNDKDFVLFAPNTDYAEERTRNGQLGWVFVYKYFFKNNSFELSQNFNYPIPRYDYRKKENGCQLAVYCLDKRSLAEIPKLKHEQEINALLKENEENGLPLIFLFDQDTWNCTSSATGELSFLSLITKKCSTAKYNPDLDFQNSSLSANILNMLVNTAIIATSTINNILLSRSSL